MGAITFDTLKFVKQLEASGIPPVQAEAFVNNRKVKGSVLTFQHSLTINNGKITGSAKTVKGVKIKGDRRSQ